MLPVLGGLLLSHMGCQKNTSDASDLAAASPTAPPSTASTTPPTTVRPAGVTPAPPQDDGVDTAAPQPEAATDATTPPVVPAPSRSLPSDAPTPSLIAQVKQFIEAPTYTVEALPQHIAQVVEAHGGKPPETRLAAAEEDAFAQKLQRVVDDHTVYLPFRETACAMQTYLSDAPAADKLAPIAKAKEAMHPPVTASQQQRTSVYTKYLKFFAPFVHYEAVGQEARKHFNCAVLYHSFVDAVAPEYKEKMLGHVQESLDEFWSAMAKPHEGCSTAIRIPQ